MIVTVVEAIIRHCWVPPLHWCGRSYY